MDATTTDVQRWAPLGELDEIRERVARLALGAATWAPAADWFETDEDLILVVDVPGIDPNTLELAHDGEEIVVAGARAEVSYGEARGLERPRGAFQRSLRVPVAVVEGSAEAQYRAGLLEVRFTKLSRTITVNLNP
jgi:HSP20 family protein